MTGINIDGKTVNTPRELATELARQIPGATPESLAAAIATSLGLPSPDTVIPPEMASQALQFAAFVGAGSAGLEQMALGIKPSDAPSTRKPGASPHAVRLGAGVQSAARRLREAGFSLPIDETLAADMAMDSPETFAVMLELAERTSSRLLAEEEPDKTLRVLHDLARRVRGRDPLLQPLNRQNVLAVIDAANEWAPNGWSVSNLGYLAVWPGVTDEVLTTLPLAMASVESTRTPAHLPFYWAENPNLLSKLQTINQRLGRKLTDAESFTAQRALENGLTVEQLTPAPHPPPGVSLKDQYVWQVVQGTDAEKMTRAGLLKELADQIVPGTARSDDEALASESLEHWGSSLSVWELHKIRLLVQHLQQPGSHGKIGEIIEHDLALDDTELGGMVRWSGSGVRFEEMVPSQEQRASNNHYSLPEMNPWSGIADFHLHATNREGNPSSTGPSGLDLAGGRKKHADGVVITFVRPGVFNVDFYTASGAVVDLGDYQIPVSS